MHGINHSPYGISTYSVDRNMEIRKDKVENLKTLLFEKKITEYDIILMFENDELNAAELSCLNSLGVIPNLLKIRNG